MSGAACLRYDGVADDQDEMQVLGHDDVGIDRYHRIMGGDGCRQLVRHHGADRSQSDGGAVGISTYNRTKGMAHAVCHMQGDVVDAWARVVVREFTAAHVVLSRFPVFHSFFWRENRQTLCSFLGGRTARCSVIFGGEPPDVFFYLTDSFLVKWPSADWTT